MTIQTSLLAEGALCRSSASKISLQGTAAPSLPCQLPGHLLVWTSGIALLGKSRPGCSLRVSTLWIMLWSRMYQKVLLSHTKTLWNITESHEALHCWGTSCKTGMEGGRSNDKAGCDLGTHAPHRKCMWPRSKQRMQKEYWGQAAQGT